MNLVKFIYNALKSCYSYLYQKREEKMEDDLIEYFLKWELEWLIPAGYEDDIKRVKEKQNEYL